MHTFITNTHTHKCSLQLLYGCLLMFHETFTRYFGSFFFTVQPKILARIVWGFTEKHDWRCLEWFGIHQWFDPLDQQSYAPLDHMTCSWLTWGSKVWIQGGQSTNQTSLFVYWLGEETKGKDSNLREIIGREQHQLSTPGDPAQMLSVSPFVFNHIWKLLSM